MEVLKRIARMCRPHAKFALIGFVALLAANATRLILPLISGWMVDDVIKGGQMGKLMPLCGAILVLTVLRAVSNYIRGVSFEKLSQNFCFDLRTGLYRHLSEMSYHFYDTNYIGEIMSRMTGDIEGLRNLLAGGVVQICENSIWFFGSLIFLFFINWKLALVMVCIAPIVAFIAIRFRKKIHKAFKDVREQNAVLSTKTQENISGVRVVKAFAQEAHEKEAFSVENRKQLLPVAAHDLHLVGLCAGAGLPGQLLHTAAAGHRRRDGHPRDADAGRAGFVHRLHLDDHRPHADAWQPHQYADAGHDLRRKALLLSGPRRRHQG